MQVIRQVHGDIIVNIVSIISPWQVQYQQQKIQFVNVGRRTRRN